MKAAGLVIVGAVALGAWTAQAPADVDARTLTEVGDRFDQAQLAQDKALLERLTDDGLVFIDGSGQRQGKAEFIAGWVDPDTTFEPIVIEDRVVMPLGPDAGVVGGEVVLKGTSGGQAFASHIRFADTFRRVDGEWRAVHIQVTGMADDVD